MKLNDAYPSLYLSAEDLNGQDAVVTIESVAYETLGQGRDANQKMVLTMVGKKKRFVLNKTNAKTIAKILGSEETDDWIGRQITIGPREVEFQGDMVLALRVSLKLPPQNKQSKFTAPQPPAAPRASLPRAEEEQAADNQDDVPF